RGGPRALATAHPIGPARRARPAVRVVRAAVSRADPPGITLNLHPGAPITESNPVRSCMTVGDRRHRAMSVVPHALSWVTRSSGSWGLGGGMIALVLGLGLVVPAGADADPTAGAVGLAVALLGGHAVGLHMPFLTGGTARLSLVGTALAAGLLVLPRVPVTLAATGAALLWGAVSGRNASRALLEGLPFGALTLLAALIVQGLAPRPGPVPATAVVGAAL